MANVEGATAAGAGLAMATGRPTATPTIMIQASTTREPNIRLERDEQRVAAAHSAAAPRPPRIAVIDAVWRVRAVGAAQGRLVDLCYHPSPRPALCLASRAPSERTAKLRFAHVAKTPRTWTGARTPSGLKRVRQAQSRHEVLQPRRSAAKTYVAKALSAIEQPADSTIDPATALAEALSALDRAAKVGATHPNAAARRKSRLTLKFNAALSGTSVQSGGRLVKTTGKAAAAKAAKVRIAAGKAGKAKGAQTAAGKARAALSKTARAEAAAAKAAAESSTASAQASPVKATAARSTKAAAGKKPAVAKKPAASKKPAVAKAATAAKPAAQATAKAAPRATAAK